MMWKIFRWEPGLKDSAEPRGEGSKACGCVETRHFIPPQSGAQHGLMAEPWEEDTPQRGEALDSSELSRKAKILKKLK